jgi:beta-lactamase class A
MKNFVCIFCSFFLAFILSSQICFGQKINYNHLSRKEFAPIADSINKILREKNLNLTIGIAMINLKSSQTSEGFWSFYSNNKAEDSVKYPSQIAFPTLSVYKFHLALAILKEVDKGKFDLNDELYITKSDLLEETHSPLRDDLKKEYAEKYEEKTKNGVSIKLSKLLSYSVSKSDNNACDILFRFLGGKKYAVQEKMNIRIRQYYNQKGVEKTNKFIKKLGLQHTAIAASEEKMHEDFDNQYLNTTTTTDAVLLLKHFYQGKILQEKTNHFLWKVMVETGTGSNKIKAGLPQNDKIILGHKTGSSFRKEAEEGQEFGLKAAENDIGIVITPKNKYAVAIFIKNSTESNEVNNALIAELSKLIFEFLN